jgi:hypothetical protein
LLGVAVTLVTRVWLGAGMPKASTMRWLAAAWPSMQWA